MNLNTLASLTLAAMLVSATAFADDPQSDKKTGVDVDQRGVHVFLGADKKPVPHVFRSDMLVGMTVRDSMNHELGAVHDLVLDFGTGHVRYAAISFGGFLGFGEKLFAVPLGAMSLNFDPENEASYLVFDVTKEKLEKSPGFDQDHWPNLADRSWSQEIDKFYGITAGDTKVGVVVKDSDKSRREERKDAREERREKRANRQKTGTAGNRIVRASTLTGLTVMNDKDQSLGTLSDMVINAETAMVTHLIVSAGAVAGVGGDRVIVPQEMAMLKQNVRDNQEFVWLPVSKERFQDAPRVGEQWPNFNAANWSQKFDRYFISETAAK